MINLLKGVFAALFVSMPFVLIGVWIAMLVGWVLNIVDIFGMGLSVMSPELILRLVGIVLVPLGGVMGYL